MGPGDNPEVQPGRASGGPGRSGHDPGLRLCPPGQGDPEEFEIREGSADYTGRLCVIGSELREDQLEKLFLLV